MTQQTVDRASCAHHADSVLCALADAKVLQRRLDKRVWSTSPSKVRHQAFGWTVHTVDDLVEGIYYVNREARVVAVHPSTWRTLRYDFTAQNDLIERAEEDENGVYFLPMDVGSFHQAVLAEKKHLQGVHGLLERKQACGMMDPLAELESEVQQLLCQASDANLAPSMLVTQLFMARYAVVQAQAQELQERLTRLTGLIEVAGAAVVEIGT